MINFDLFIMYCFGTVGLQIGGVHKQLCSLIFISQCVALKLKTGRLLCVIYSSYCLSGFLDLFGLRYEFSYFVLEESNACADNIVYMLT